jgi:predicted PurR-regulated permease PerM
MRVKESALPPLWVMTSGLFIGAVWLAVQLKELVVLLVLGYFLAYAVDPLLRKLEHRGCSRPIAFGIVVLAALAILTVLLVTTVPALVGEFRKFSENLQNYITIGRERLGPLLSHLEGALPQAVRESASVGELISGLPVALSDISGETVKRIWSAVLSTLLAGYSQILTLINVALLPFIVYYLAVDMPGIHRRLLAMVPFQSRSRVELIFREIDGYVSSFVRGQFLVCTVLFALYALGLWIVGVDLWLLLAVITGFGNLVPYVGFLSGIVISSLMALVTFGDMLHVVYVWLVFAIVQALEGTIVTPRILGGSVGLSPLVIILALFAGGQLAGLLGIFLAVPAAAAFRVLVRHGYQSVMER